MRYGAVQRAPAYRCGKPEPKRGSDEVSEEIVVACGYHSAAVAAHIKYLFYRRFGSCGHLLGGFGVGQEYILVGRRVWHMAYSPDQSQLFTTNGVSGDVTVIDVASLEPVKSIKVGRFPWGAAMRP